MLASRVNQMLLACGQVEEALAFFGIHFHCVALVEERRFRCTVLTQESLRINLDKLVSSVSGRDVTQTIYIYL